MLTILYDCPKCLSQPIVAKIWQYISIKVCFIACQNFTQIIREISPDKVQTLPPFTIIWHVVENYVDFPPLFEKNEAFVFCFWLASTWNLQKILPSFRKKYKWKNVYTVPSSWITSRIFRAKEYMIFAVFATIVSLKHLTHKVFQNPCPNKSFMKKKHVFLYSKNIDTMWSFPKKLSFSPEKILVHPHHNMLYWFFSAMKRNLCQFFVSIDGKSPLSWGGADFTKPRGNLMWTQVSLLGGSFYCNYCLIPLNCQK